MQEKPSPIVLKDQLPSPEMLGDAERYETIRFLEHGSGSDIFQARDTHFGLRENGYPVREVCLKKLKDLDNALDRDAEIMHMYREAQLMAQVSELSSYFQRVYDFFIDEFGDVFIVLELNRGDSLKTLIEDTYPEGLPTPDIIAMLDQLAGAIDIANAHGVNHLDIKPGNILKEGKYFKITDFSISPLVRTFFGVRLGTAGYTPPERLADNDGNDIVEFADVYALAVTTYKCLCGELHVAGAEPFEIDNAIKLGTIISITEQPLFIKRMNAENLDGERINQVFTKAFAQDPKDRYQSAKEFAAAITEALTAKPEAKDEVELGE